MQISCCNQGHLSLHQVTGQPQLLWGPRSSTSLFSSWNAFFLYVQSKSTLYGFTMPLASKKKPNKPEVGDSSLRFELVVSVFLRHPRFQLLAKQQTSFDCMSSQQKGAWVSLSRKSPTASTPHFPLLLLVCATGVVSSSLPEWFYQSTPCTGGAFTLLCPEAWGNLQSPTWATACLIGSFVWVATSNCLKLAWLGKWLLAAAEHSPHLSLLPCFWRIQSTA